jgi:hypothetical protein
VNSKSDETYALSRRLFAELVIIVAGVLIALAIDEWRTDVEESRLANVYVRQLIVDLDTSEVVFLESAQFTATAEVAATSLLNIFEENQQAELKQVRDLLIAMSGYDNPVPVLGTVDALINTGDLRLIHDPVARSRITEYLSYVRDYLLIPLYDIENNHYLLFARIETLASEYGISPRGTDSLSRDPENADVSGFIGNNEAYAAIAQLVRLKSFFSRYAEATISKMSELKAVLENSERVK